MDRERPEVTAAVPLTPPCKSASHVTRSTTAGGASTLSTMGPPAVGEAGHTRSGSVSVPVAAPCRPASVTEMPVCVQNLVAQAVSDTPQNTQERS